MRVRYASSMSTTHQNRGYDFFVKKMSQKCSMLHMRSKRVRCCYLSAGFVQHFLFVITMGL